MGPSRERRDAGVRLLSGAEVADLPRRPEEFADLLKAPPAGLLVAARSLSLDDTRASAAVEVSWRAPTRLRAFLVGLNALIAWYGVGLALLIHYLISPVLGLVILCLTLVPPIAVLPWLSWRLSGATVLEFAPDRRLCISHRLSVLGLYDATMATHEVRRAALRRICVTSERGRWWVPWTEEVDLGETGGEMELRLRPGHRGAWLAEVISAWSDARVISDSEDLADER